MGLLDVVKSSIQNSLDKKKKDREMMEQLQKEAAMHEKIIFEEEFKKNALEVAKAKAKQDAAKLSGLQKMRATNRAMRLTEPGQQDTFMGKLSSFTQKNIAKREENLKRTSVMRETAKQQSEERERDRLHQRNERTVNKPTGFGQSSWKM